MPTITEESWNLHIEQETNFLSTPTPHWRIHIFKITGGDGHPDPEMEGAGGLVSKNNFFRPSGLSLV